MKKLIFILYFISSLIANGQNYGIFSRVYTDEISMGDSLVTHIYPDTLVNTQWVNDRLSTFAVDSARASSKSDTSLFARNVDSAKGDFAVSGNITSGNNYIDLNDGSNNIYIESQGNIWLNSDFNNSYLEIDATSSDLYSVGSYTLIGSEDSVILSSPKNIIYGDTYIKNNATITGTTTASNINTSGVINMTAASPLQFNSVDKYIGRLSSAIGVVNKVAGETFRVANGLSSNNYMNIVNGQDGMIIGIDGSGNYMYIQSDVTAFGVNPAIKIDVDNSDIIINSNLTAPNLSSGFKSNAVTYDPATGQFYQNKLPHVFMVNDSCGCTQSIGTEWTTLDLNTNGIFQWVGKHDVDSIGKDTIQIAVDGHYWYAGNLNVSGSAGRWLASRIYNVTDGEAVKGVEYVTLNGSNIVSLQIGGYCVSCNAGDKLVIQIKAESNTTVTFVGGQLRMWANHGY